jgi:two-component system, cell cycle sensor histidine kinase and response regulator CckA
LRSNGRIQHEEEKDQHTGVQDTGVTSPAAGEEKYRTFFENATDFFYIHDFQGNLIDTNLASKMHTSYSDEELSHMNIKDVMPKAFRDLFDEYMKQVVVDGSGEGIISVMTKEGEELVIEYRNTVVRDASGRPLYVQGSGRDITASIRANRALKRSEERYRSILDGIEEAYFEVDLTGNITFFNHSLTRDLKYSEEETRGMNYRHFMDEENAKKVFEVFHQVFVTGKPAKAFDWALRDKDGNNHFVEASVSLHRDSKGNPSGFKGIVRDISQRVEAQKERDRYEMRLAQAQKLEAIGTLAGGIAHDFNNMLSAIIGYTELARNDLAEDSRARKNLDQVLKAGMRARDLIARILSYSRKFEAEREAVNAGLILEEAMNLLRASIPTSIEISCTVSPERLMVFADPTELHQIVMNLCTNAYQAMEGSSGCLRITLEPARLGEGDILRIGPHLLPGAYLRLAVSDTGCGMDDETIKHIFDPFFTTKKRDKGTGLGLATVHRIVTELRGAILVESSQGSGTAFIIHLPVMGDGEAHTDRL